MASDKEETDPKYYGMEQGIVTSNDDPLGLFRVQLTVPGIIDQPGPWALPVTIGGGGPQRGMFSTPPVGADVNVFFLRGDPQQPRYVGGHWGQPAAGEEVPTDAKSAPANERKDIHGFETDSWKMTFDDRKSASKLRFMHKVLDLIIDIDAVKGVIEIAAEAALVLRSRGLLKLDGPQIQIGGRTVTKNGKPIG